MRTPEYETLLDMLTAHPEFSAEKKNPCDKKIIAYGKKMWKQWALNENQESEDAKIKINKIANEATRSLAKEVMTDEEILVYAQSCLDAPSAEYVDLVNTAILQHGRPNVQTTQAIVLLSMYGISTKFIAQVVGRTRESVTNTRKLFNISTKHVAKPSYEEKLAKISDEELVSKYRHFGNLIELSKHYKISTQHLSGRLKELGELKRRGSEKAWCKSA